MSKRIVACLLFALLSVSLVSAQEEELVPVRLQLQWVAQSQFAGYYAAEALGFYEAEGIDMTILEGAVEIVPQQVVAAGGAEFGIAWVPKVLETREQGPDLVHLAQILRRSGILQVALVDSGIETVEDFAGMRIGTWGFGNEHELFAAMRAVGIDPENPDDVTIVQQPFDMALLINGEVDAAQATIYNEYAMVLEQVDPATGEFLFTEDDLYVIDFNEIGTAMLQDHLFANADWLAENEELAVAFLRASFKGWIYCRDNFDECVDIVLDNGPTLGEGHMRWMLNEINGIIWPAPDGIGVLDLDMWEQTVNVSLEAGIITEAPSDSAYRLDLTQLAIESLLLDDPELDVYGEEYERLDIQITPGGE